MQVKKAVIPVAGLGTRMLPATKAIPKEMLPVVDKPLIHENRNHLLLEFIFILRINKKGKQLLCCSPLT